MVVYVHVCIIIQTELQKVTDLSADTFKGSVFLPKLQVGPGRPSFLGCAFSSVQFRSTLFKVYPNYMSDVLIQICAFLLFATLQSLHPGHCHYVDFAPGVVTGSLSLGYDIYNTHVDK